MRWPRWLYRLHAWVFGYFWKRCPVCKHYFSGWEWGQDGWSISPLRVKGVATPGVAVCSRKCYETGQAWVRVYDWSPAE